MHMSERLARFGSLQGLDLHTTEADNVRRSQTASPRAAVPVNVIREKAVPDCPACNGNAELCPLGDVDWRLCPHAPPPAIAGLARVWPESR